MVIAPEHPSRRETQYASSDQGRRGHANIVSKAANKSDMERTEFAKKKTGVFTGSNASESS